MKTQARFAGALFGAALLAGTAVHAQDTPTPPAPADADPVAVVGAPRGQPLAGAALDARTEEVGGLLRCPVCQGLSVADSPSSMAQKMKAQVREMLAAGYEPGQILAYFERSYGEFVQLSPPLRGVNWLVWLAPVAGLLAGAAVVGWALRAPRRGSSEAAVANRETIGLAAGSVAIAATDVVEIAPAADLPGPDTLPEDSRLAAYVLSVREQVYGWPGGLSPASRAPAAAADAVSPAASASPTKAS